MEYELIQISDLQNNLSSANKLQVSISSFGGQVFPAGLQNKMPNSVQIGYIAFNGSTPVDAAGTALGKTSFSAVDISRTLDANTPFLYRLLVLGAPLQVVVRQVTDTNPCRSPSVTVKALPQLPLLSFTFRIALTLGTAAGTTWTFSNAKLIRIDHGAGDAYIVGEFLQFVFGTVQIAYTTSQGKTSQVTINQMTNTVS